MENFSFKNVSFAYPEQENKALRNISFDVNQGEFLILCGPSGCGKSTLLRHLKTCLAPHGVLTGEILFNGKPLNEVDERTQSQEIGFVLQSPENQVVTDKVWHELAFGLESLGYEDLALSAENVSETLAIFRYAPEQDGAIRRDDYISISVALDDGSIYSFDASRYSPEKPEIKWNTDEEAALSTLPENVQAENSRKVIIKSPGGKYLGCWEISCISAEGEKAVVYVDADSGKQCKIEI